MIRETGMPIIKDYRSVLDALPDVILLTDPELRIVFANRAASELFRLPQEDLCDVRIVDLLPASSMLAASVASQAMETEKSYDGQFSVCAADGTEVQLEWCARIETESQLQVWSGRRVDYSQQSYDELFEELKRKEVLLKETHHRIKNNLQVVASLINLQIEIDGVTALDVLHESQNRIRTMALIHEHLYENDDALIDLPKYVHQLAKSLCASYGSKQNSVKVIMDDNEPVLIHLDRAVPCGLIANEILSNSLKYAFPAEAAPEIRLSVVKKGHKIIMELSDNGKGLPPDISLDTSKTLGLRLVKMLVGQLSGELRVHRNNGTHYRIQFEAAP